MPEKQPQIFLSYSWANVDIADAIDNDFKSVGITFQRDMRDVAYTKSIKEFMQRVGKSDFVVMLISNEYLKSENCMYEVIELLGAHEFEKRILPVILSNAEIYNKKEQEKYYDYWQEKLEDAKRLMGRHTHEKTIDDKKKVENIYNCLGLFFQKITDLKSEKYGHLRALNYKPMLDKIGFDEDDILEQLLRIRDTEDKEDQELALEKLLELHPNNPRVLFYKAFYAEEKQQYKKAKKYYEDLIEKHSYSEAHNNLSIILTTHFRDNNKAIFHFQEAIRTDSKNAKSCNNLGLLFIKEFSDHNQAKIYFEKAIAIDPQYAIAHYNYAKLLKNSFSDFDHAKKHYELALQVNPQDSKAHNNFADLLENHFHDYQNAKLHYEKAIELDPDFEDAKKGLANLINENSPKP